MRKINKSIAKILLMAFIITNILSNYPSVSFAVPSFGRNKVKVEHREKTEILIGYKDDDKSEDVKKSVKNKLKLKKMQTKKKFKKNKVELVEIDKNDNLAKVMEELKKDPEVKFVQPNYPVSISTAPPDPMFNKQWGLLNNGQSIEGYLGRSNVDINAVNAWNITAGSDSVVVGILDTGIDISHMDLKDNIFKNAKEVPMNGVDDDRNGYVDDINGWDFMNGDNTVFDDSELDLHGTMVAGVIAAKCDSVGITGAAPNVKLLPLKFINGNVGYTCDIIDAIEYAMTMGVKIVNCSFGGGNNNLALKDAMANSGMLFVCAAGNNGADSGVSPIYPASFDLPNVISVAALDSKGVIANFSSYGAKTHIAAPGVDIISTTPENTYDYMSGTSMSSPFVAGTAALIKSYLPQLTVSQIAERIKQNVVPCTNLQGKVSSGGRVDAYAALTNSKPQQDTYDGEGNDTFAVSSVEQSGDVDTWYTADQLSKIKEKLHYGESGVSPASGNYSFTVNDMSIPAPGFTVNISRTYNSKDDKGYPFGKGWTFGFEGSVKGSDLVTVTLPTGSVQRFRKDEEKGYVPEDSRSTLVRNTDNTYILTTKDQYTYGFNSKGLLIWMKDRNGNTVNIDVDSNGKIRYIRDTVGRLFTITYNLSGMIETITDSENRTVRYEYENLRLVRVIDPMGGIMRYHYDTYGLLDKIEDHNFKTILSLEYIHTMYKDYGKVLKATDAYGCMINYSYDEVNKKTTITDMNCRKTTYWFDDYFYTKKVQEPDGVFTYTEYHTYGGKNKYGDIKYTIDRNGNKTENIIDDRGNITKTIYHADNSIKEFKYDDKNNLVMETDRYCPEEGEKSKLTFYIYDDNKINLVKKVQPLNGTDEYDEAKFKAGLIDISKFAVTSYQYYTAVEAKEKFNCSAGGLLKSETDPENNTTIYTYDMDGNTKTITDAENKVTTYEYDRRGMKTAEISPKNHRIEYTYDGNGLHEKTKLHGGETTRIIYDFMGRKLQEISPNQYDSSKDDIASHKYNDTEAGFRYEYYDSGKVKKIIQPEKDPVTLKYYETGYTYDVYGNVLTETRPNGSIYRYEYDVLDRLKKTYFKDSSTAVELLLSEMSYAILDNGRTQETETRYLNSTQKAVTVKIYDYAGNLVETQYADGTKTKTTYNSNGTVDNFTAADGSMTYYKYDGLNRLTEQWTPFEISNGNTYYTYTNTEYYKNGWKKQEKSGKEKVLLYALPKSYVTKNYTYYKNGKVKAVTDNSGGKTEYTYDDDGNTSAEKVFTHASKSVLTEYDYNYLDKVAEKRLHVKAGDICGNDFSSASDYVLKTSYTYDANGNLKTVTTPDTLMTTYYYDNLNRQVKVTQPGRDETGEDITIETSTVYDWEGKPLKAYDARSKETSYEYNQRGLLVKVTDANKGITAYEYDLAGRKIREVSPKNYTPGIALNQMSRVEYVYDLMDRVKTKIDIFKNQVDGLWKTVNTKSYKYDNSGNMIKELDALGFGNPGGVLDDRINLGYGTEYLYNFAGKLMTVLDPVSKERGLPYTTSYEYDGLGRKISETNAKGVITLYGYDDAGNVTSVKVKKNAGAAEQIVKNMTYDLVGRQETLTDGNRKVTKYEYNELGKLRKVTYPGDDTIPSNTVTYQYDAMGNLKEQKDSEGKVDTYSYDNQGRNLSHTTKRADGSESITTSVRYDAAGNKRFETDGNNVTTEYIYDDLNRVIAKKITVGGVLQTTGYTYDPNGNQETTIDWRGNTWTNVYDPLNRLIEKKDPYATIQKLEYYRNNLQSISYDALGNPTIYSYDKNGRLISTTDAENHTTGQAYDDAGNVHTKTDGRGTSTTYNYDELNRLKEVVNSKNETTSYTYDLNGNMLTQTDGEQNTTIFIYNAANKLSKRIDANGTGKASKTESYTYYADGSMKTKVDRNGKTTYYEYDIHGRLKSQTIDSESISYTYDNNGNQLTMTDSTGTTVRTYDELNRVTAKSVPNIGKSTFQYDIIKENGMWAEKSTDPKGNITEKNFDRAGRLKHVTADGKTTTYNYYANGNRESVVYPNNTTEGFTYYADNLLKTLVNRKSDGTVIDSYSYKYDAAHNQTEKTDKKGITSYTYDSLNRLEKVTEQYSGKTTSYTYDKAGNRQTETVVVGSKTSVTTYLYNEQNRLKETLTQDGSTREKTVYTYDNNGNMLSKKKSVIKPKSPGASQSIEVGQGAGNDLSVYRYNDWNQLVKSTEGSKVLTYAYNGDGYRVEKTVGSETTRYLYEGDKVVLELNGQGAQTARNVQGLNLLARTIDGQTLYNLYNGHADVVALVDAAGTMKANYYYDAFGNVLERNEDPGVNNPYLYAGYMYDGETGLYYLNARYYDSKVARFLTEDTYRGDPNDPLSLNLYTYCHNEPIMYTDPTGHAEVPNYIPDNYLSKEQLEQRKKNNTPTNTSYKGNSITDYLNSIKVDSSFANRKELAEDYGIKNYTGTAAQNTALLNAMMNKKSAPVLSKGSPSTSAPSTPNYIVNNKNSTVVDPDKETGNPEPTTGKKSLGEKVLSYAQGMAVGVDDSLLMGGLQYVSQSVQYATTGNFNDWDYIKQNNKEFQLTYGIFTTIGRALGYIGNPLGSSMSAVTSTGEVISAAGSSSRAITSVATISNGNVGATEGGSNAGGTTKNTKTPWDIKTNATDKIDYKINGQNVSAYKDPNTGLYWARDTEGHGGSAFKVFELKKGGKELQWKADADEFGNFITDKHKGSTGLTIKVK